MKLNKLKKSEFSNAVLTGKHHFCFSMIVIITGIQLLAPLENDHGLSCPYREKFQCAIFALSLIFTWLGFLYPVANAFVLLTFGAPFVIMLFAELKR